jgi:hypothetical protein
MTTEKHMIWLVGMAILVCVVIRFIFKYKILELPTSDERREEWLIVFLAALLPAAVLVVWLASPSR